VTGVISGTAQKNTVSGVANFSTLRILSGNTFVLKAASTDMVDAVSASFTVINYVHTMTLASSSTTSSLNFMITLTVTMKGEDNLPLPGTCTVTLTEITSNLHGVALSKDITGGTDTFDVYLSSLGSKTIVATCSNTGTTTSKTSEVTIDVIFYNTGTGHIYLGFKQYNKLFSDC
jgi:hypothetical protein